MAQRVAVFLVDRQARSAYNQPLAPGCSPNHPAGARSCHAVKPRGLAPITAVLPAVLTLRLSVSMRHSNNAYTGNAAPARHNTCWAATVWPSPTRRKGRAEQTYRAMTPSTKTVVRIAISLVLWFVFFGVRFSEGHFGNGSLQTFCLAVGGPVEVVEWVVQAVQKRRKQRLR